MESLVGQLEKGRKDPEQLSDGHDLQKQMQ